MGGLGAYWEGSSIKRMLNSVEDRDGNKLVSKLS